MKKFTPFTKLSATLSALTLAAGFFLTATPAFAQNEEKQCSKDCLTETLYINTGYDWSTGSEYPGVSRDEYWQVTMVPTGGGAEPVPYCAHVLKPYPSWDEFPSPQDKESQWISALPSSSNGFNNWIMGGGCAGAPSGNPYRFERKFHICGTDPVSIKIDLTMLSDDLIDNVMVDNASFATFNACTNPPPNHIWPNRMYASTGLLLSPGDHVLVVDLRNIYGVAMGVNIQGAIYCEKEALVSNKCTEKNNCKPKPSCFEKAGMKVSFAGYDENGNCVYKVEAYGASGATIIGYEWNLPGQAPFVVHTSAGSNDQVFTVPMNGSGTVSVIIHAVNKEFEAGQDPCCTATFEKTVYCGEKQAEKPAGLGLREIKVFPNPAKNEVTVVAGETPVKDVKVISLNGQVLRDLHFGAEQQVSISLEGIAPGTYNVLINGEVTKVITKL